MSDNQDYMSDKILEECAKSDARPSLLYNKSQKRIHKLHNKQVDEHQTKRPKSYKEQEKETWEKGLRTVIPVFKDYNKAQRVCEELDTIVRPRALIKRLNISGLGQL